MARRGLQNYGIDSNLVDLPNTMPSPQHTGTAPGALAGFSFGYNAANAFREDMAQGEAAEAGNEASQQQVQQGERPDQSEYYDMNPATGKYSLNEKGQAGYNEDGSAATPEQMAAEKEVGISPTKYGLGKNPAEWRETPYAPEEARAARLEAVAKYWESSKLPNAANRAEAAREKLDAHNIRTAENTVRKLTLSGLQRNEQQAAAIAAARPQMAEFTRALSMLKPGTEEHTKVVGEMNTLASSLYDPKDAMALMGSVYTLAEHQRKSLLEQERTALVKAARTPESAVEYYNSQFKDYSTAKLEDLGKGEKGIVRYDSDGNRMEVLSQFKDWETDKGGKPRLLESIPQFAEDALKLRIAHEYKLKEIAKTTEGHVAAYKALASSKEIKLSPEEKTALDAAYQEVVDAAKPDSYDPKKYDLAAFRFNALQSKIAMGHGKLTGVPRIPEDKPDKPLMTYKEFIEAHPGKPGESESDSVTRYRRAIGAKAPVDGGGVSTLEQEAAKKKAAESKGKPLRETTDTVTTYGFLTPEAVLERDVRAGVPAAIEYKKKRDAERAGAQDAMLNYRLGLGHTPAD